MDRSAHFRLAPASTLLLALPVLLGCEDISVTVVPVSAVDVVPEAVTLTEGESLALQAIPEDGNGTPLPGRVVEWTVQDGSVALVSSNGVVHGLVSGVTVVEAHSEGVTGRTDVLIVSPEPEPPPVDDAGGDDEGDEDGDEDDDRDDDKDKEDKKGKGRKK